MGINGLSHYQQQTNIQITKKTLKVDTKNNEATFINETLKYSSKKDFLDISNQTKILNEANNQKFDYSALEKKIGIDSSKWGVEAVSDDIFEFTKLMYENFKLNHQDEEDSQKILDDFYNMAKSSIQQGYDEAMDILGKIDENTQKLTEGTLNRTMEKLDNWYENGGKVVNEKTTENESSAEITSEKNEITYEESKMVTDELLRQSEQIKNEVVKLLEEQGIYINEQSTKKPSFSIEG